MRLISLTDIGVKRKENQDNYWSALLSVDGEDAGVICMCDGMGGLNSGGLASRMVASAVRDYLKTSIDFYGLKDVIEYANKSIYELSNGDKSAVMGTTCTVLLCYKGKYRILHVGDSRCYLLSNHEFNVLTVDHSAIKQYGITKEKSELLYKRYKNSLTRCIGVKPEVTLDYYEGNYSDGDSFLVCSDGLWHYLEDYDYFEEDLFDLKGLVQKCMDSGETDNITVGVLTV